MTQSGGSLVCRILLMGVSLTIGTETLWGAAPEGVLFRVEETASLAGFTLGATLHTVTGLGGRLEGEFRVVPAGPAELSLDGEVRVTYGSLETGNNKRDRKMRQETLDVDEHPLLRFRPRGATGEYPAELDGGETVFGMILRGQVLIRGVQREVEIPVRIRFQADRLVLDGTFTVRFKDFGIPDPSVFLLRVKKFVEATVHLEASRASEN